MVTFFDPCKVKNNIVSISSKSYVHRLLIASALSKEPCFIFSNIVSKDMQATVNCLNAMGAKIEIRENGFEVLEPIFFEKKQRVSIDCGESGSTARFLLPLLSLFSDGGSMTGHGRLTERPMGPLVKTLSEHGAKISGDFLPMMVEGKVSPGKFEIAGNISSQFITGLLFFLPLLEGDSEIVLTTPLESEGYVYITLEVLKQFGIKIDWDEESCFRIKGGQTFFAKEAPTTEGDWSNSGFLLALGAVKDPITVSGLNLESVQGDCAILEILEKFGAKVTWEKDYVTVSKGELHGIDAEVSKIPDLVPAIAAISAFADSKTILRNVGRLRLKESDRVEAIIKLLSGFGVKAYAVTEGDTENLIIEGNSLQTEPKECASGAIFCDGFNDHRIVMAAAILAYGFNTPVNIKDGEAINKSFPNFFDIFCDEKYCLIGEKLGHSFSKELHNAFGNPIYGLKEIPRDSIDDYFLNKDFKGINVTIPYKETALKYCNPDFSAKEIGAVNTLVNKNGEVFGYNTDFLGVEYMLKRADISLEGKKIVILGSGGTSKTMRYVCKRANAANVVVLSRGGKAEGTVDYSETALYSDAEILINTTPVGMYPDFDNSPISLDVFNRIEAVVDVIYNPLTTKLVAMAKERGLKATNGLPMLIAQGFFAEELFKDEKDDSQKIEEVISKVSEARMNKVLIGMPGCGKTTLGKKWAAEENRGFFDTDEAFFEKFGVKPGDYIVKYGEAQFRKLESEIVREAAVLSGYVIATGGGVILNPENVALLKRNGKLFFIDRPIDALARNGRPLSQGDGLKKLYNERLPLYREAADVVI